MPGDKRTCWNEDKPRLVKHRSLPELYLGTIHCDLYASAHPAEHASAPRVSLIDYGPKIQGQPGPNDNPYLESTKDCTYSGFSPRARLDHERTSAVATATLPALQLGPLAHSLAFPRRHTKQPFDSQSQLISDCRDPLLDSTALSSLSSSSSRPSSVDRSDSSSKPMTVLKSSRSLKATRRNLVVGLSHNDTKKSSLSIDYDDHDIFTEILTDNPYEHPRGTSSKRFSPLPPNLRTIRRRKRPSIGRTSADPEGGPVKPIAISLTFSSSATPQILPTKVSMSALCDRVAYSAETDSEPRSPILPSQAPEFPEKRDSTTLSTRPSTPLSASTSLNPATVRLGHPSRPYYSAIRKQGISPPSSRRSSIKDPGRGVAAIRPISYSPSPLPAFNSTLGSSPQRHLSLSAVPHTSLMSAFSLYDESDDNVDEELPVIPLTPLPASGRRSFGNSLASVAKTLTRKRSSSGPSTVSTSTAPKFKHLQSSSSPQAVFPLSTAHLSLPPHHHGNMKGVFRMSSPSTVGNGASGIGFSVSGEAELKMALAFSDAQTTKNITGPDSGVSASTPVIQEEEDVASPSSLSPSPISPLSSLQLPSVSHSRNSIAGRVKKITRGLKDMLIMTTHGAGNNDTSSTTATTPTTTTT